MKDKKDVLVNMDHVIGELAQEHGVPYLTFDQLTTLGYRAVTVYGLTEHAKTITFADLCVYICMYVKTVFGAKVLKELQNG